jgi:NAD(P)-dependent dehydrogenase (short-subunit alcohol dehydrogenase family)
VVAPPVDTLTDLNGTVVMVTGAGRGIGRGISLRLAAAGTNLALAGRDTATLNDVADEVRRLGVESVVVTVDVAVETEVVAAVGGVVDALGHLDGLVNCAGIQPVKPLLDQAAEDWNEMLDINARGVFLCTREAAKAMIDGARGGSIVNITSIEASQPAWGHSHYNASKAAVLMHTRAAALELGRHGIRVNSVSPGLIWSPTLEHDWPQGVARWLAHVPLGRLGQPDDVADAVLFLLSPMSRFVSGADLVVDGGVLAHPTW